MCASAIWEQCAKKVLLDWVLQAHCPTLHHWNSSRTRRAKPPRHWDVGCVDRITSERPSDIDVDFKPCFARLLSWWGGRLHQDHLSHMQGIFPPSSVRLQTTYFAHAHVVQVQSAQQSNLHLVGLYRLPMTLPAWPSAGPQGSAKAPSSDRIVLSAGQGN